MRLALLCLLYTAVSIAGFFACLFLLLDNWRDACLVGALAVSWTIAIDGSHRMST